MKRTKSLKASQSNLSMAQSNVSMTSNVSAKNYKENFDGIIISAESSPPWAQPWVSTEDIRDSYTFVEYLGGGNFGTVRKA